MTVLLPLLANELIEFFKERPGAIVVAVVFLIGLLQGLGRMLKSLAQSAGTTGRGGTGREDFGPGTQQNAGSRRQAAEQEWSEVGDDDDDDDDEDFDNDVKEAQSAPPPLRIQRAAPVASPVAKRVARRVVKKKQAPSARDDQESILSGAVVGGLVGATGTTHDDDVSMARELVSGRRPSRDEVRTAILWAEIIGPPRALKPYRSPARRGGSGGSGPSSIAIVPLHDRPRS